MSENKNIVVHVDSTVVLIAFILCFMIAISCLLGGVVSWPNDTDTTFVSKVEDLIEDPVEFTTPSITDGPYWKITLVQPNGVSYMRTAVFSSHGKPCMVHVGGGLSGIRDENDRFLQTWEKDIVAPNGWMIKIEPYEF